MPRKRSSGTHLAWTCPDRAVAMFFRSRRYSTAAGTTGRNRGEVCCCESLQNTSGIIFARCQPVQRKGPAGQCMPAPVSTNAATRGFGPLPFAYLLRCYLALALFSSHRHAYRCTWRNRRGPHPQPGGEPRALGGSRGRPWLRTARLQMTADTFSSLTWRVSSISMEARRA